MSMMLKHKVAWPIVSMVGGVMIAFVLVYIYTSFSNTYATFVAAAIMGSFVIFILRRTKLLLWALLMICLPITVDVTIGHTGHISGAGGYVISLFDIVLVILYLLWVVEIVRSKNISIRFFPNMSVPAMFLVGITTFSMVYARLPQLAKFEIIEVVKMYLAFLYLANNIKKENELHFVVAMLIFGLIFEGVIGFLQHRYGDPFWPSSLGGPKWIGSRVTGTWWSFNDFGWYLTFLLPIALSLLFSKIKSLYKNICGIALTIGGGSMMWTSSRGAWISFSIAAIFVMVYCFCKIRGKWGLVKTVVYIMAITILISPIYPRLYNKLYDRFGGNDGGSAESRLPQYQVAYNIIKSNPITGVGLNNYTEVMKEYDTTKEGLESITSHAVHNIFLHIAAEAGLFGLGVFLWFVTVILAEGMKRGATENGFVSYVAIGLVGGIIAFLFHGLVDTASLGSKLFMFLWCFAGIIAATKRIEHESVLIPA